MFSFWRAICVRVCASGMYVSALINEPFINLFKSHLTARRIHTQNTMEKWQHDRRTTHMIFTFRASGFAAPTETEKSKDFETRTHKRMKTRAHLLFGQTKAKRSRKKKWTLFFHNRVHVFRSQRCLRCLSRCDWNAAGSTRNGHR